jgi:hypothetical protein
MFTLSIGRDYGVEKADMHEQSSCRFVIFKGQDRPVSNKLRSIVSLIGTCLIFIRVECDEELIVRATRHHFPICVRPKNTKPKARYFFKSGLTKLIWFY